MDAFDNNNRSIEENWLRHLGKKRREDNVLETLMRAWEHPFTTKSDFARHQATIVGMLAEEGFITLRKTSGHFGATWRITADGLEMIGQIKDEHKEIERRAEK